MAAAVLEDSEVKAEAVMVADAVALRELSVELVAPSVELADSIAELLALAEAVIRGIEAFAAIVGESDAVTEPVIEPVTDAGFAEVVGDESLESLIDTELVSWGRMVVLVMVTLTYVTSVTTAVAITLPCPESVALAEAEAVGTNELAVMEADGMMEEESVATASTEVLAEYPSVDDTDAVTEATGMSDADTLVVSTTTSLDEAEAD